MRVFERIAYRSMTNAGPFLGRMRSTNSNTCTATEWTSLCIGEQSRRRSTMLLLAERIQSTVIQNSVRKHGKREVSKQQDEDSNKHMGQSPARFTRIGTFTSRIVAKNEERAQDDSSSCSQSRDSSDSTVSGISDDLQGLLIPGRNVILRFESMSATELKVKQPASC